MNIRVVAKQRENKDQKYIIALTKVDTSSTNKNDTTKKFFCFFCFANKEKFLQKKIVFLLHPQVSYVCV